MPFPSECYDTIPIEYAIDASIYIHIASAADVHTLRRQVIEHVWPVTKTLPTGNPTIETNVADPLTGIPNVDRVDKLTVVTPNPTANFTSVNYLWIPASNVKGKLCIVHQGHRSGIDNDGVDDGVREMVRRGVHVLGMEMPSFGPNTPPSATYAHNDYGIFDTTDPPFSSLRFFLEPVHVCLNYLLSTYAFNGVLMTGHSGGGWTTHLCAAIDPRISLSYPDAGSYPIYLRSGTCAGNWDREQMSVHGPLYGDVSYLDLYIMAAVGAGRKSRQLTNQYDNSIATGILWQTYVDAVKTVADSLGGDWDHINYQYKQDGNPQHWFPEESVWRLLKEFDVARDEHYASNDWHLSTTERVEFSTTGTWTAKAGSINSYLHSDAPWDGVATWTFPVRSGRYRVSATHNTHANRSQVAPFEIFDGSRRVATVRVNQEATPNDRTVLNRGFVDLGEFSFTSGTAKVVLKALENSGGTDYVIADAVYLERIGEAPKAVIELGVDIPDPPDPPDPEPLDIEVLSVTFPSSMETLDVVDLFVQFRNTGTTTLPNSDKIHMRTPPGETTWTDDGIGFGKVVGSQGQSVAPGATATWNNRVKAPSTPGTYDLKFQMFDARPGGTNAFFGEVATKTGINVTQRAAQSPQLPTPDVRSPAVFDWDAHITYDGSVRLPLWYDGVIGGDNNNSFTFSGLSLREEGGTTRLLTHYRTSSFPHLVEHNIPSLKQLGGTTWNDYQQLNETTVHRVWGGYGFTRHPDPDVSKNVSGPVPFGDFHFDQSTGRIYLPYWINYYSGPVPECLACYQLNGDGSKTFLAQWKLSATQSNWAYFGPNVAWLQSITGKPWVTGAGGNYSGGTPSQNSYVPCMSNLEDPDVNSTGATYNPDAIYRYKYEATEKDNPAFFSPRQGDYYLANYSLSPQPDGEHGYGCFWDECYTLALFDQVDLRGGVHFIVTGRGRTGYDYGAITAQQQLMRWFTYDWQDMIDSANNIIGPRLTPHTWGDLGFPFRGSRIVTGTHVDQANRKLYVNEHAVTGRFNDSSTPYRSVVHVFSF